MDIQFAKSSDANVINALIHQIYYPTYKDILSKGQIDFMLEQSYTIAALEASMLTGQDFYILSHKGFPQGFIAVKHASDTVLRIEKLYLLPETQGQGFGKALLDYASELAFQKGNSILELNVNRGNKAYYFYLKHGFIVTQEVDIPYFEYILDDYIMQKTL